MLDSGSIWDTARRCDLVLSEILMNHLGLSSNRLAAVCIAV